MPGNFDIEFNYDQIQWETGDVSGGVGGSGGSSARVGYSNGTDTSFELPGSGVSLSFLGGGPQSLVVNSLNSGVAGRYIFNVRNGSVVPPPGAVREPATMILLGTGLVGIAARVSRRRRKSPD